MAKCRIKIIAPGIFTSKGELPVGSTLDMNEEPLAWKGRYELVGDEKGKTPAPTETPKKSPDADDPPDAQEHSPEPEEPASDENSGVSEETEDEADADEPEAPKKTPRGRKK